MTEHIHAIDHDSNADSIAYEWLTAAPAELPPENEPGAGWITEPSCCGNCGCRGIADDEEPLPPVNEPGAGWITEPPRGYDPAVDPTLPPKPNPAHARRFA